MQFLGITGVSLCCLGCGLLPCCSHTPMHDASQVCTAAAASQALLGWVTGSFFYLSIYLAWLGGLL